MSLLERLRNRRYDGNALIQDVLKTIDESHNYVKVRFTPEYVNLEYWVKEPEKMVPCTVRFTESAWKPRAIRTHFTI